MPRWLDTLPRVPYTCVMTTSETPRIRHNADESAVCQHRDLTVCGACLDQLGSRAVDVYGAWYVCESAHAAAELRTVLGVA